MHKETWKLVDLFAAVDLEKKQFVTAHDLQFVISHIGNFSLKEIEYLLLRFDRDGSLAKDISI